MRSWRLFPVEQLYVLDNKSTNRFGNVLTASDDNSFAIKPDGSLWTWGKNYAMAGNLGLGDVTDHIYPLTRVGEDSDWRHITAGCLAAFAIKQDDTLWGWGFNAEGYLGLGDTKIRSIPTRIGSGKWLWVDSYSCTYAIKEDGTLWSWGYGSRKSLGYPTEANAHQLTPRQIGEDSNWQKVSAGGQHAILTRREVRTICHSL